MILWYPFSKINEKWLTTNSQIFGHENFVRFQISFVTIAMKNDSGTTENNVLKYQKLWEMLLSTNRFWLKPDSCDRLRRYNLKYWPSTVTTIICEHLETYQETFTFHTFPDISKLRALVGVYASCGYYTNKCLNIRLYVVSVCKWLWPNTGKETIFMG